MTSSLQDARRQPAKRDSGSPDGPGCRRRGRARILTFTLISFLC
jgi:hypothetical protein